MTQFIYMQNSKTTTSDRLNLGISKTIQPETREHREQDTAKGEKGGSESGVTREKGTHGRA